MNSTKYSSDQALEENQRLRHTMRDLVALSTLPAIWIGLSTERIAASLAEVLLHTLAVDLVYIRLTGRPGERVIEEFKSDHARIDPACDAMKAAVESLLISDRDDSCATITNPVTQETLRVAVTHFGVGDDCGVLVTASERCDFPTEQERLLLGVGANQTAVVIQRRRAEDRLREYAERLRITLASIGDGVIATDTAGYITNMNEVAETLTGWKLEEAKGVFISQVYRLVDEDTHEPSADPLARALHGHSEPSSAIQLRKLGYAGPIIALTADAMQGDMIRCIESGCNDYLSKPIDKHQLLEKVQHYLQRPDYLNAPV